MSAKPKPRETTPAPRPPRDKWRYGWRYVRSKGGNGRGESIRIPLRKEDLLHPQEDDFIVNTEAHHRDCRYLVTALQSRMRGRPDILVVTDHRVDWGVPGLEPFGPDVAVFEGVYNFDPTVGTFYTARWRAKPVVAVEVTSLDTRRNDTVVKVRDYFRGRVPLYVIVDRTEARRRRAPTQLLAFRAAPDGYAPLPPDEQGRVWLEPFRMWMAVGDDDQVVCFDEKGQRILDSAEALLEAQAAAAKVAAAEKKSAAAKKRADAATERADAAKKRADAAKKRADAAKKRADEEARDRQEAEARARELEAELRRLRGERP
jgi:Uma2 family endonuclease